MGSWTTTEGALLNNRYLKVRDISEGSFGLVFLAKDTRENDKLVAVKYVASPNEITRYKEMRLKNNFSDISDTASSDNNSVPTTSTDATSLVNVDAVHPDSADKSKEPTNLTNLIRETKLEVDILRKLGLHINIATLYDTFENYIVLEYCSRGDLYEAIRNGVGPSSTHDVIDVMMQLIEAVEYCHAHSVYHRDIKPENILIAEDWSIKLSDFGLATTSKFSSDFDVGSERYMAPELFDKNDSEYFDQTYDAEKADVWSIGICLLNIVFGKNPFQRANGSDKMFLHFASNRETLFDIFPSMSFDLFGVLRHSLTLDPNNRDLYNMKQELLKLKSLTIEEEFHPFDDTDELGEIQEKKELEVVEISEEPASLPVQETTDTEEKSLAVSFKQTNSLLKSRRPLGVPTSDNIDIKVTKKPANSELGYADNDIDNDNDGFKRQDFLTPRSVFNNYMDKIEKNRQHKETKNFHQTNHSSQLSSTIHQTHTTQNQPPSYSTHHTPSSQNHYHPQSNKPGYYRRSFSNGNGNAYSPQYQEHYHTKSNNYNPQRKAWRRRKKSNHRMPRKQATSVGGSYKPNRVSFHSNQRARDSFKGSFSSHKKTGLMAKGAMANTNTPANGKYVPPGLRSPVKFQGIPNESAIVTDDDDVDELFVLEGDFDQGVLAEKFDTTMKIGYKDKGLKEKEKVKKDIYIPPHQRRNSEDKHAKPFGSRPFGNHISPPNSGKNLPYSKFKTGNRRHEKKISFDNNDDSICSSLPNLSWFDKKEKWDKEKESDFVY
ncbi:BA75_03041T0 [Komagataella pastoris]|uniref:non-specific serine/threonine protein kinase n=1 Tax=Komagataella pastoris TaxID=4922 RepID=A0A1B2JCA6_PICPA|nr:BA75_03041T0 [Komagataella pastoris]